MLGLLLSFPPVVIGRNEVGRPQTIRRGRSFAESGESIASDNEEHSIGGARKYKSRRAADQSFVAGTTDRMR